MPQSLCAYCLNPIDPTGVNTVVVQEAEGGHPTQYAHRRCYAGAIAKQITTDFKEGEDWYKAIGEHGDDTSRIPISERSSRSTRQT